MKKLKVGVLGGGYISQLCYIPPLIKNKNIDLKCVIDERSSIKNYVKEKFNIEVLDNLNAALKKYTFDIFFVILPRKANVDSINKLIKNKISIFTEKPLSYSKKDASKIMKLSRENNIYLSVGYMKIFDNNVDRLKNIILKKSRNKEIEEIRVYTNSFKMNKKIPKHQKPLESRKKRLKENYISPVFLSLQNIGSYDWFMNVVSHSINYINYFFNLKNIEIIESKIQKNKFNIVLYNRKFNYKIVFNGSKSLKKIWDEGLQIFSKKTKLKLKFNEPFDKKSSSKLIVNSYKNTKTYHAYKKDYLMNFEKQINYFINCYKMNIKNTKNSIEQINDEMEFIEKLYKLNK